MKLPPWTARSGLALLLVSLVALLADCNGAKYTSAEPAVGTKPTMKMTQTDFVIRVVNYSCQISGCTDIGQRNANLGTPGVRKTLLDMCWVHMSVDAATDRAPMTVRCFDRATMSIGDPGLSQIWSTCQQTNDMGFEVDCFSKALAELTAQGADYPITSMIPGALTDEGAAPHAGAPAAVARAGELSPSCAEWQKQLARCSPEQAEKMRSTLLQISEQDCAQKLPQVRDAMDVCAKNNAAGGVPADASGGGERIFVSAIGSDARLANGILVTGVVKGSGPHRAGLRPGDVITTVNGKSAALTGWARAHLDAGLGGTMRVTIKHGKATEDIEWTIAKCSDPSCQCVGDKLCTRVGDAPPRQWTGLLLDGSRVKETLDGPGRAAGIQSGDEIVRINEIPVRDAQSVIEIVGQTEPGDVVNVTYARGGKESKAAVKLAAPP